MEQPIAGPSQGSSRSAELRKLDLIDVDSFDWKLYEGSYKGTYDRCFSGVPY